MTNTLVLALLVVTFAASGCGDASSSSKKNDRKGPFPVQRNDSTPVKPAQPIEADKRTGQVGEVKPNAPPVNLPPLTGGKKGVKPGEDAPELVLEDAEGKVFMLSSFRGKQPVLIVFGASW
ncbi:MAG: hypothetical protein AAB074_10015 [Planctomycetota bacterium]